MRISVSHRPLLEIEVRANPELIRSYLFSRDGLWRHLTLVIMTALLTIAAPAFQAALPQAVPELPFHPLAWTTAYLATRRSRLTACLAAIVIGVCYDAITFQAVQRQAGVSHAFLYNHPELRGRILSGDTFVTARNVADMREAFSDAVADFDAARPMWQLTVVEGLEGGRAALILRFHHTITDGEGGIKMSLEFIDFERNPPEPEPVDDGPPPVPRPPLALDLAASLTRTVGSAARQVQERVGSAVDHVLHPTRLAAVLGELGDPRLGTTVAVAGGHFGYSAAPGQPAFAARFEIDRLPSPTASSGSSCAPAATAPCRCHAAASSPRCASTT